MHSFEAEVQIEGQVERVAFIRAPKILDARSTRIIATLDNEPVGVQHGNIFGASFHPELTGAKVLHRLFLDQIKK